MLKYLGKRLLRSLLTLVVIVVIVFVLLRLMPIEGYFNNFDKLTEAQIENKLREMGLRDPLIVQIFDFFVDLFHGDLGVSNKIQVNVPITE